MKPVARRTLLAAAATVTGLSALEYASLTGKLDYRRRPASCTQSTRDRYAASLRELASGTAFSDGAVVHVGHSTHLLSVAGARMLTDPWFDDPAFGSMSHAAGPATTPEGIGGLDAVLVSHDHADHLDRAAADRLDKRATAIVATSYLAAVMRGLGFADAVVLPPWQSIVIKGARVTAVPGVHDVTEVGFVVQGAGRSVYFAGDTRLHDDLRAIAERLAPTMAILPVDGARAIGGDLNVMTPEDAVQAARTLGVQAVMPSHAEAELTDPLVKHVLATTIPGAVARFASGVQRALPEVRCHLPEPGQMIRLPAGAGA